jgi:hypothetical protein
MTLRSILMSSVVAAASMSIPSEAHAECVSVPAQERLANKINELVFSGIVVEIVRAGDLGYRATFEVDRVWKGAVSKRFDLFVSERSPEIGRHHEGEHYIVFATPMVDPVFRKDVGLAGDITVAFTPSPCTDPVSLGPDVLSDLGAGYEPTN